MRHLNYAQHSKISNEMLKDLDYAEKWLRDFARAEHQRLTKKAKRYFRVTNINLYDQDGDNFLRNLTTVVVKFATIHPKHRKKTAFTKKKSYYDPRRER